MIFTNKKQLNSFLQTRLYAAVEKLTEEIYQELITFIQEDIYDSYKPKEYERTFEFRDVAWNKNVRKAANEIVGEIFYDGMKMTYNPNKYQHGSRFEDRREKLAEILAYTFFNPAEYLEDWDMGRDPWPVSYWGHTMWWLENNWSLLVDKALKEVGLK